MCDLSILLPMPASTDVVQSLVSQLARVSAASELTCELLCICPISDDRSIDRQSRLASLPCVRLLCLKPPSGLSAALTAGIQSARGAILVAMEPSGQYRPEQLAWLIERLARADLVVGRRSVSRTRKLLLAAAQLPRRLLLGLEVRDPDCLFWAARRETLAGIELAFGQHRFLGSLVTTRGFRVCEMHVDHDPQAAARLGREAWPSLGNLLAVWWQRRQWRSYRVEEWAAQEVPLRKAA